MTKSFDQNQIEAGQAIYTPSLLNFYDLWVLGISNTFIWKCATRKQLAFYKKHIQSNHLDVGVGTGFYLDKCCFPKGFSRLGLLDMNPNCLAKTADRVKRYSPDLFQANILDPLNIETKPFQSVAINYLLHCLPGSLSDKAIVFDHLKPYITHDGHIFGATLLSHGVTRTRTAKKLMAFYQAKGIFSNQQDSLDDLHQALATRFPRYHIRVIGCCALFIAYANRSYN